MTIKDIFDMMQRLGLVTSQVQFSTIWLGRSPRYFSYLLATGREPGVATLSGLRWRLANWRFSSPRPEGIQSALGDLEQTLAAIIDCRALVSVKRAAIPDAIRNDVSF